jgi:flavin reductase (DIM6/NTAB) family NADH-FMN oxidoreductase RutF
VALVDGEGPDTAQACRLILGCLAPRPVAWITTMAEQGRVNAAPFSSSNEGATGPPMHGATIAKRAGKGAIIHRPMLQRPPGGEGCAG